MASVRSAPVVVSGRSAAVRPTAAPAAARLRIAAPTPRRAVVVRAAEGEGEAASGPMVIKPTKYADFKDLSVEQIDAEVEAAKLEMFFMRNKQATRQVLS